MLTSIEQLEKEIEKFHTTVAESNELVRLMKSIANAVSKQTDTFHQQSDSLEKTITRVPTDIKSDYDEMLKRFSSEKSSYAEVLANSTKAFLEFNLKLQQDIAAIPENTMKANSGLVEKALTKLREINAQHNESLKKLKADFASEISAYRSDLTELQKGIKAAETNINEKYAAFLIHLETLNIEQVFKDCQEIKTKQDENEKASAASQESLIVSIRNHLDKKMTLLYCGFGLTIILLIVLLFLK